jgi:glutaminyl-peptide cyclotransferase
MGANAFCMNSEWDATSGKPLIALILLDMIGSPEIIISRDSQSSPALLNLAQKVLDHLGKGSALAKFAQPIADDHIPFLKRGVNAIDIIDFHHLDTWHKEGDDPDKISHESVQLATQLALGMALEIASNPKVFLKSTD